MPEGHKTHYFARQHAALLVGDRLKVTSPQGRFRADARKISGGVLDEVEAIGKHLFYHFEGDRILHIHLGRYGKFRQHQCPAPKPVGQVRARIVGEQAVLDLTGPTTCRVIDSEQKEVVMSKLGPDPLGGGRRDQVWKNVSQSDRPIGALLLDQSVVAGVGNIFRAEILFEVGMDPATPGSQMTKASFDRLWRSLIRMMKAGLRYGRIISVTASEVGRPLSKIDGNDRFRVYAKQSCPRCDTPVETIESASRKLYWCRVCQSQ